MLRRKSLSDLFALVKSPSQASELKSDEGNPRVRAKPGKGEKEYKVGASTFFTTQGKKALKLLSFFFETLHSKVPDLMDISFLAESKRPHKESKLNASFSLSSNSYLFIESHFKHC